MTLKEQILDAISAHVRQRPGMEPGNYGSWRDYRTESRQITRDLHDFRTLLAAVSWRESITAGDLLAACRDAYSGRLACTVEADGRVRVRYCTGQYFPTEFRRAACAVLASALWARKREDMPAPRYQVAGRGAAWPTMDEAQESARRYLPAVASIERVYRDQRAGAWVSAGGWLRGEFRREFGARIARHYFN